MPPPSPELVSALTAHSDAPLFSLSGRSAYALVVDAYDIDTFQAVLQMESGFHRFIIRVAGIDGPEMTDKNPVIRDWAVRGRNRMLSLIAPGIEAAHSRKDVRARLRERKPIVFLNLGEMDKYGRVLADVRASEDDTKTFQEMLIEEGFCKAYGLHNNLTKDAWTAEQCGKKYADAL
jgi:endonuclease YncB( thermonuclease family)